MHAPLVQTKKTENISPSSAYWNSSMCSYTTNIENQYTIDAPGKSTHFDNTWHLILWQFDNLKIWKFDNLTFDIVDIWQRLVKDL